MPAKYCSWGEEPKRTSQFIFRAISYALQPINQNCQSQFFNTIGLDSLVQFPIGNAKLVSQHQYFKVFVQIGHATYLNQFK